MIRDFAVAVSAKRGSTVRRIKERHFMASTQAAVVLGASGSVGNALIKELIRNGSFNPIVTLVRRSQPDQVAMARDAGAMPHPVPDSSLDEMRIRGNHM